MTAPVSARPGDGDIREQLAREIEALIIADPTPTGVHFNTAIYTAASIARNFPLPSDDGTTVDEAAVLNAAADALEGGLGVKGTPRNLYEFRLRAALAVKIADMRDEAREDKGLWGSGALYACDAVESIVAAHPALNPEQAS